MMTPGDPLSGHRTLTHRAKAILTRPKEEWPVVEAEPITTRDLITGYAMILAAIPPVCGLIGGQIFGFGAFGIAYRPSLGGALAQAILTYILSLVSIFVLAFIVDALAPTFLSQKNRAKAIKLVVYASTAGWVAGIFSLIPALGAFALLAGLYSLYLLYLGLPVMMKTPEAKILPYLISMIVAAILVFLIAGAIVGAVVGSFVGLGGGYAAQESGEVTVPGIGKVDLDKLNAAGQQMENAAKKMENATKNGTSAALAPAALQAMLPEKIGRFARTEVESSGMAAGASARGTYKAGNDEFRLEVTDMAAVGALAGLGAALNVQSNKETATGYERTTTIDDRIVTEQWDKQALDGKYGTTIANRFMVEANGKAATIDELKGAVTSVDLDKLAALAAK